MCLLKILKPLSFPTVEEFMWSFILCVPVQFCSELIPKRHELLTSQCPLPVPAGSRGTPFAFPGFLTFPGVPVFLIAQLCPLNFFLSGLSVLERFISERSKRDHTRSGGEGSFLGPSCQGPQCRCFAAARHPRALPRCTVPSPGKPCLSCTLHKQFCSWSS